MVGDFDAVQIRQTLQSLMGNWNSQANYHRPPRPFHKAAPGTFHIAAPAYDHGQYLALLTLPVRDDSSSAIALMIFNHYWAACRSQRA